MMKDKLKYVRKIKLKKNEILHKLEFNDRLESI